MQNSLKINEKRAKFKVMCHYIILLTESRTPFIYLILSYKIKNETLTKKKLKQKKNDDDMLTNGGEIFK